MIENKTTKDTLPETFDTFEEMAEFWDTHDVTDYEEYLTPVEATVIAHLQQKKVESCGRLSAVGGHFEDMLEDI
jgi:hypothetical protein